MSNKGMGKGVNAAHPSGGLADPNRTDEQDLASDVQGRNKLHGDDQAHVRNERRSAPDTPAPPKSGRSPR